MIETIKEHLILAHQYYLNTSEFKPAWKYAYYNPAKKNNNGDVVFKSVSWSGIPIYFMAACAIIQTLVINIYLIFFILPVIIITLAICYPRYWPKPKMLTINQAGITLENQTYPWQDYVAVWICETNPYRRSYRSLILIKPDGNYTFLNVSFISDPYSIGTAIRDFQPESYKNSLPSQLGTNDHT